MTYICTNRLNQDVLEHFFVAIRSKGGLNDHPSPKEFKYKLRNYILARNTEHLSGMGNVECDTTEWLGSNNLNCSTLSPNMSLQPDEDLSASISDIGPIDELDDLF